MRAAILVAICIVGLVIFLAGMYIGYTKIHYYEVGIFHIDMTDSRKDLVRIELTSDLDEIVQQKKVILSVNGKIEKDFFGGKENEKI